MTGLARLLACVAGYGASVAAIGMAALCFALAIQSIRKGGEAENAAFLVIGAFLLLGASFVSAMITGSLVPA